MSFVDLATLTLHRRNELEARINSFMEKADHAIVEIKKLQMQARNFVQRLNCEPSELKERFLSCMQHLEEYTYLITDFNLAVDKLEIQSVEQTPVLDTTSIPPAPTPVPSHLIDVLSESTPSTSSACPNLCPSVKPKSLKVPKEEQLLIEFSSTSCSSESVPVNKNVDKEVQCEVVGAMNGLCINEGASAPVDPYNLPAQPVLQADNVYPATIMSVDGFEFWVITENTNEVCQLMTDMTEYYKANRVTLTAAEISELHYCAFYDDDSDCYYRAFFIKFDENEVEVFLVDTGEFRTAGLDCVQPLVMRYCVQPPYARCCHLAGERALQPQADMAIEDIKDLMMKQELFLKQYIGTQCHIEVDDNTSESLGVYVILPTNELLNDIVVKHGLVTPIEKPLVIKKEAIDPPELVETNLDITQCPEYEDPVEAVTGYHNRDEADICKHYKGGPDKTCFKGSRCKKKHIVKHPDGWTLDRVEAFVCNPLPLPAPGTWHKVVVTCVCHFDRVYVQFTMDKERDELPRTFGLVLPPRTLTELVRDMNSPASRLAYKPLTIAPALGEMVAALYPLDGQWYRARVTSVSRADQNIEVMYVDYGNIVWVKEDDIRALEPRWAALPAQAIRARLAGVVARGHDSKQWASAKQTLTTMLLDHTVHMHVIDRSYDEVTVELFTQENQNVADQLASLKMVDLEPYSVIDDTNIKHKLVVP